MEVNIGIYCYFKKYLNIPSSIGMILLSQGPNLPTRFAVPKDYVDPWIKWPSNHLIIYIQTKSKKRTKSAIIAYLIYDRTSAPVDRPTDWPTNHPTDGHEGSWGRLHFQKTIMFITESLSSVQHTLPRRFGMMVMLYSILVHNGMAIGSH